jgi:hypothetical protein
MFLFSAHNVAGGFMLLNENFDHYILNRTLTFLFLWVASCCKCITNIYIYLSNRLVLYICRTLTVFAYEKCNM